MDLIEDEDARSRQLRVVLESAGEDTFGHDFDSSVFGDHRVVASSISDEFAESSAREFGHPLSNCSSGYSTWLENDDAAADSTVVEKVKRNQRRFTCARRG
jgi:hypothetical protein